MINAANKYKPVTVWKTTASCVLRTQDINSAEAYSWKSLFSFGRFSSHDALIGFLHDTVIGYLDLKKKKNLERGFGRKWHVVQKQEEDEIV